VAAEVIEHVVDPPHPPWGARSPKKLLLFEALRDPLKYGKNPSETC
jgi:hypothetical protein